MHSIFLLTKISNKQKFKTKNNYYKFNVKFVKFFSLPRFSAIATAPLSPILLLLDIFFYNKFNEKFVKFFNLPRLSATAIPPFSPILLALDIFLKKSALEF